MTGEGKTSGIQRFKKKSHEQVIHVDLTLAFTRCSCSALREVAVFVRECGKCKPLYASVIERCVTLPVGTWWVARKQSFASTAVTCTMSQLRTLSERKLSLSATRQPFTVEIARLFVFSLSKSLFFVPFFLFIRPITYTRASREHALDACGSSKPELQQRRQ